MIFQGDIIIKTAIELGIEDMRKNPWLIDHMLEDLVQNPYLNAKYGQKHVDACKEWLKNNQINVYMRGRDDQDQYPCVTIEVGQSPQKEEMSHLGDASTESVILLPSKINKPISYVVKPFTPGTYDPLSGELSVSETIDLSSVAAGMILVNPDNGQGFIILDVLPNSILLENGLTFSATKVGVVPKNQFYKANVEHRFFQETFNIGCHAHGDPNTLLWLWSIITYAILRYTESLLEANGFAQSTLSTSPLNLDSSMSGPEKVYSRYITLSGQVENTWIKSPRRFIEKVSLKENTSTGYRGGIKILSNIDSPDFIDQDQENWITKKE